MQNLKKSVVCHDIKGKRYEVSVKDLSFRPSVYAVIIRNNKILLSKQRGGYDFPGGGVNLGETINDALIREVKEETGLTAKVGKIVGCYNSFFILPEGGSIQGILMYYLCEVVSGIISTDYLDEHEKEYADKPEWIKISELGKIKFYNSVDSVELIKEAVRIKNIEK